MNKVLKQVCKYKLNKDHKIKAFNFCLLKIICHTIQIFLYFTAKDRLFFDFLEIWQSHGSVQEVFDLILDFIQSCSHAISFIKSIKEKMLFKSLDDKMVAEIESERNTWRLIYALYQVGLLYVFVF